MKRFLKVGALATAIVSQAVLGWLAFRPAKVTGYPDTEVTLWTAGATPAVPALTTHVALPDASSAPEAARRVPDTAFLRREFRSLRRVTIAGEGVVDTDAENLRGLAVTWQRPERAAASPVFVALSAPRTLALGQPFTVQGRMRGLTAGVTSTLSLEAPNGAMRSVALEPVRDADLAFSIASDVATAAGAFEWKLRLGAGGAPLILGAEVTAPELPRVLLLAASPNVEAARLQRWLAESGARVTGRTRVSADQVRFTAANDSPAGFQALDATLLDSFDIVVARESALLELSANERAALEDAVRDRSLGLLLVGETAAPGPGPFFAPWTFAGDERGAAGDDEPRLVRLRLAGGAELAEPVATLSAEIVPAPLMRWLA
ncbi:MAG: hypothetical protein HY691_14465, partial [Chloroflexi bacterium]|nr:hypothetical protein [Chloroflexota bacterium]